MAYSYAWVLFRIINSSHAEMIIAQSKSYDHAGSSFHRLIRLCGPASAIEP